MRAVVQRVQDCSVSTGERICGHIESGLLVYLGIGSEDSPRDIEYLAEKVLNLRIFADRNDKMNLSVLDVKGEILVVSQFTLYGDARRGRRPSYSGAAGPEKARRYYSLFIEMIRSRGVRVEKGEFAARMQVRYTNLGPVTILLDSTGSF